MTFFNIFKVNVIADNHEQCFVPTLIRTNSAQSSSPFFDEKFKTFSAHSDAMFKLLYQIRQFASVSGGSGKQKIDKALCLPQPDTGELSEQFCKSINRIHVRKPERPRLLARNHRS